MKYGDDAMVGHARCLVKIYEVVESPSWYNVRPTTTREDGRPSKYHRTKGYVSLLGSSTMWRVACDGLEFPFLG
jgi:hypothetical protein